MMESMMSLASKILWSEGLTVGPQQFQRQDMYHEMRLQWLASALNPHLWGVRKIEWNRDALLNNSLRADTMSLLFQDGEIVDAPGSDNLPPAADLTTLPQNEQVFTYFAALPALMGHGGNLAAGARYFQHEASTLDLYTEALSIDVAYLAKSVRLLSPIESREDHICFPIVRIRRTAAGGFEIDPGYIPPSIQIGASSRLPLMLDSLMSKLAAKIESLYGMQRMSHKNTFEVHSGDTSSYWLLNTISTASASLLNCSRSKTQHPEQLFEKLSTFAGTLMTFSRAYAIKDLPAYSHIDPGPGFQMLDRMIRELVDIVISSRYFTIPLTTDAQRTTHHRGELDPASIGPGTELCLAVKADMPALELVAAVPLLFKVGSPHHIEGSVASALPGLGLAHMAQVPAAIPVRPNTYYFALNAKDPMYEAMLKSQAIVIYVPSGMKSLQLELIGIES
jgi:type VI secretion system protein ImpJ